MVKFKRQKDNKSNYDHFLSRVWLYHPFFSQFCFAEGRKHDSGMLADSGLLPLLERHGHSPAGQPMCVYGDPAPFRNAVLTSQMEAYNTCMSKVRTSVEWLFGEIANSFKFLDFKKNLKIELSSVGKLYVVYAILRNVLTCFYGNQASEHFDLDPPNLNDYFA